MMMQKSQQTFDRVIVIESTADAIRSGRELIDQVLQPFADQHTDLDFAVEYHMPGSRVELFALLAMIANDTATRDGRPVLHLEIHGTEDRTGLHLADGTEVPWVDLADPLLAINRASRNNLVVVLAVCFGEGLARVFSRQDRAPAFGLVGPNSEISFGRFMRGFRAFYRELLATGNGDRAVQELNSEGAEKDPNAEYGWHSAEGAFRDHFRFVLETMFGTAAARQAQAEAALMRARNTPRGRSLGLGEARKRAKDATKRAGKRSFEKLRDRYLMLDLFPEQRGRYTLRYEDCVAPGRP